MDIAGRLVVHVAVLTEAPVAIGANQPRSREDNIEVSVSLKAR